MSTTPRPQLDAPVSPFSLTPADGGGDVGLDVLTASGPVVLTLVDAARGDDARASMLRELGQRVAETATRLVLVSPGDSALGRQLAAVRAAEWMTDPDGAAARALGVLEGRKLRRTRRRDGLFVIDQQRMLWFAFTLRSRISGSLPPSSARGLTDWPPSEPQLPSTARIRPRPRPARRSWTSLVRTMGRLLGLSPNELTQLVTASRVRDLGMSVVPDEIITKEGPLSDDEWAIIRRHPQRSAEMLGDQPTVRQRAGDCAGPATSTSTAAAIRSGLEGDQIPLGAPASCSWPRPIWRCCSAAPTTPVATRASRSRSCTRDAGVRYDARVVEALQQAIDQLPGLAPAAAA